MKIDAENLPALAAADCFAERAKRADLDAFDRIMGRKSRQPPDKGDEVI